MRETEEREKERNMDTETETDRVRDRERETECVGERVEIQGRVVLYFPVVGLLLFLFSNDSCLTLTE